jgi:hypothetical protein
MLIDTGIAAASPFSTPELTAKMNCLVRDSRTVSLVGLFGGAGGARTHDPRIMSPLL